MLNHHLFLLINAPPGLTPAQLFVPMAVARWTVPVAALALVAAWPLAGREVRAELLRLAIGAVLSLVLASGLAVALAVLGTGPAANSVITGTRYLSHGWLPGFPSREAAMLWASGFAAFAQRRLSAAGPFLLTLGLVVGWSRVYLGASLPWDIAGALPVAAAAALVTGMAWRPVDRLALRLDGAYGLWRGGRRRPPDQG